MAIILSNHPDRSSSPLIIPRLFISQFKAVDLTGSILVGAQLADAIMESVIQRRRLLRIDYDACAGHRPSVIHISAIAPGDASRRFISQMSEVSAVETKLTSSDFSLALVETCDFAGADFTRAGMRPHPITPREHPPSTARARLLAQTSSAHSSTRRPTCSARASICPIRRQRCSALARAARRRASGSDANAPAACTVSTDKRWRVRCRR